MLDLPELSIEQCIARRLMVDIRLFAERGAPREVRELPASFTRALVELQPCGLILFRENLASVAQCRELTAELRQRLSPQLIISVDQEGGLVTRLPRREVTSFSGNMALAACPVEERTQLARQMAAAQATELRSLGFNLNFVPCLDVNSNPANPVIHVRSFGDCPQRVAELGTAVVQGTQSVGVAACVKHFPGHGDTSVDSHSGLPRVDRARDAAEGMDLAPFRQVIAGAKPALVMSAHIQYPALDDSTLPGTATLRPATLSRRIISGLLREEMGFAGVVISDALDMGAISKLLSPQDAVLECFRAGVDIALMPLLLRTPASLDALFALVDGIAARVRAGALDEAELRAGAARVSALQAALRLVPGEQAPDAEEPVGSAAHRQLERRIASGSVTCLRGEPAPLRVGNRVHLLMPCAASAQALQQALLAIEPTLAITTCSLDSTSAASQRGLLDAAADICVVGVREPAGSAVAAGGAEDGVRSGGGPRERQYALLDAAAGKQRVVLLLCSPYGAAGFYPRAETVLATYDPAPEGAGGGPGPAYVALAAVLLGREAPRGTLPVDLQS